MTIDSKVVEDFKKFLVSELEDIPLEYRKSFQRILLKQAQALYTCVGADTFIFLHGITIGSIDSFEYRDSQIARN